MKFTLAVAAIGTASAHGHCPFKAFFESMKPNCPNRDESKMLYHGAYHMKASHTFVNSLVKGWYHDSRTEVLGEQCYGDWMHEAAKPIHSLFHKMHGGDIFNLSIEDAEGASDALWGMIFRNVQECGDYKRIHNYYSWCMDNIEVCKFHQGVADRIIDNQWEILADLFQVVHNAFKMNKCDNTEEHLAHVGLITQHTFSIMSTIHGFQGQYNRDEEVTEVLSFHEMHQNVKAKMAETPRKHEQCPIKTLWHYYLGDFNPIGDFVHEVKDIKNALMPMHHRHHAKHSG